MLRHEILYHEIHGTGSPVLLIAGLGADSSCWAGAAKKFSNHFQTIVFDNPGSGRSPAFKKPHTIRHLADEAVRLLDHLKINKAHLIGHSMGGYIAQEIAINYPERVNRLVLEGTAPVSSRRNNVLFADFAKKLREKEAFEDWIKTWAFWLFSPTTFASGTFVETFIKMAAKYPYSATADGFSAQVAAITKFDVRDLLSAIKAKTLIIEGADDILIRPEEARGLDRRIKLIKNAAHYVHLENPVLFTKIATEFLIVSK